MEVILIVNVALTIKNIIIRLIRFLEAFVLDPRVPPGFNEALPFSVFYVCQTHYPCAVYALRSYSESLRRTPVLLAR
jgi:hypothetical protein